MNNNRPGRKVCRFLAVFAFLVTWTSIQAQYGSYDRYAKVLVNTVYTSDNKPIYFPIGESVATQINGANGSISPHFSTGNNTTQSFTLNYTPDTNFVGLDTVIFEVRIGGFPIVLSDLFFVEFVFDVVPSLLTTNEDYYTVQSGSSFAVLPVLSNDHSTVDGLTIESTPAVMGGNVYNAGNQLIFFPEPAYQGMAYLSYTVCDAANACASEIVNICVVDTTTPPLGDTLVLVTAVSDQLTEFLPSSNFYLSSAPTHGTVEFIPNSDAFIYTPDQMIGMDEFEVSDGVSFRHYQVDVLQDQINSFAVDDEYVTQPGQQIDFDVKNNDRTQNFLISSFSQPAFGEVTYSAGEFHYLADSTFIGLVTFDYEICALQHCEIATVSITVSNFEPNETIILHELTGLKNRELLINYDVPIDDYEFSISVDPIMGIANVHTGLDTISEGCVVSVGRFMITYTPDSGFSGFDEFTLSYCSNGICKDVVISIEIVDVQVYDTCHCQDQCVWPGDVNFDGQVSMTDLLSLGRMIGNLGDSRPYPAPSTWYGQFGSDWDQGAIGASHAADRKHCDTNGDGMISISDTTSISTFYGKQHQVLPPSEFTVKPYSIGLDHDLVSTPTIGDTITLYLTIGTPNAPGEDLSGVSFNIAFDPAQVDSSYTQINPVRENWITREGFPLFMKRQSGGHFDLGLSRVDHEANHGYGRVFEVDIIIDDDIDGLRTDDEFKLNLSITNINGLDQEGREFLLPDQLLSLDVRRSPHAHEDIKHDLVVYPNPVQDQLHVVQSEFTITSLWVSDMQGRLVLEMSDEISATLSTQDLPAGLYSITALTSEGVKTSKFVRIR